MSRFNKSKPIFLLGIDLEIETVLPCALRHPAVAGGPGPKPPSGALPVSTDPLCWVQK